MFILSCNETVQMCYNAKKILIIVKTFVKLLQWSVPLLLVFLGTWDMFKAVTKASDQKAVQDATKSLIRRLVAGLIVFLVQFFVRLVLGLVERNIVSNGDVSSTSWISCWNNVDKANSSYFSGCNNIYNRSTTSSNSNASSSDSKTCTCVDEDNNVLGESVPRDTCTSSKYFNGRCSN